jgi:hypothetical protein
VPLLSGYWLDNASTRSVGLTRNPAVFLIQPVGWDSVEPWRFRDLQVWDFGGAPKLVRSLPRLGITRYGAAFSDSIFFFATHHQLSTVAYHDGIARTIYFGTYEETNGVVISPRGDRAAIRVHGSLTGPPVFSTTSGDTVYHLRQMWGNEGVAFSATGDTLLVLGYTRAYQAIAYAIDAATGRELRQLSLPQWSEDMAYDPGEGMLYLAVLEPPTPQGPAYQSLLHLLVLDAQSFQIIGDMAVRQWTDFRCFYREILIGDDGVFFICAGDTWRFDRIRRIN